MVTPSPVPCAIPALEQAYYWAQISSAVTQLLLLAGAIFAATVSWRQFRASTFFEITRYTMSEPFRQARRRVIKDIEMKGLPEGWWKDASLNDAASDCASHYDMIGRVIMRRGDRKEFVEAWGQSVVRTYKTLRPFMEDRWGSGSPALTGYRFLYDEARRNNGVMSSLNQRRG